MDRNKTMIAIGVGCRRGSLPEAIESLIHQALSHVPVAAWSGLFTIEDKVGEPGLIEAAKRLGLNLTFVPREALRAQAPRVRTRSRHADAVFGVSSVAEAAALAGAGAGATLIVPRIARQGVTCAVAAAP